MFLSFVLIGQGCTGLYQPCVLGEMIKAGKEILIDILVKLFNKILTSSIYPKQWKISYLTPIHKKGSIYETSNYRGICVNSVIAKLFSNVLNNRLMTFIKGRKLLNDAQIGFIRNARTSDHMFILRTLRDKYANSPKKKLYLAFIDFKSAYDSIWRDALLYKIKKDGIDGLFYKIIRNMYSETKIQIKCNNKLSVPIMVKKGVKQGDSLSCILFNMFLNDLTKIFNYECEPVEIGERKVNHLLYADDLVLISQSKDGLQRCLNNLNTYCKTWRLTVNLDKSKVMIMSKSGRLDKNEFYFNETRLENVQRYTYLGITFSASGSFTSAQHNLTLKGIKAICKLKKSLQHVNFNPRLGLKLFDQLIYPILTYSCEIWCLPTNKYKIDFKSIDNFEIEKVHLKFCKYILGVSKRASNLATMGELGRYPLMINCIVKVYKYLHHVITKDRETLLYQAYIENLSATNNKKFIWLECIYNITEDLNLNYIWNAFIKQGFTGINIFTNILKSCLIEHYINYWFIKINKLDVVHTNLPTHNKLELYSKIKQKFVYEKYLDYIVDKKKRISLCKFRISNHHLSIERGRYLRPVIPVKDRLCLICDKSDIENEEHFLLHCTKYNDIRTVCNIDEIITSHNQNICSILNSNSIDNIRNLSKFISLAFQLRGTLVNTNN